MLRLVFTSLMIVCLTFSGAGSASADRYYNSMLTGSDRTSANCGRVYNELKDYNIHVISSCGFGVDADCNKRIKSTADAGITEVKEDFDTVIEDLTLNLNKTVNSKGKCVF